MLTLKGKQLYLRALEPEDLEFIFAIENDEDLWELSHTQTPYSRFLIKQYLEQSHRDIFESKQLRLIICENDDEPIGLIDLFDFDFKNKRAGVGILIKSKEDRQKGFGMEALELLINYSFNQLHLHQLYCNVSEDNLASIALFENNGFTKVGLKKDWNFNGKIFINEFLFQRINN